MKHALRSLLKSPGFTTVAVLTLALGIGATTTVFSWIERVLLNPLPGVADPGRIVAIETVAPGGSMVDTSYPDFRDLQQQVRGLSHLAVFKERPLNLGEGEQTERAWAELVSGNFFEFLGVRPRLGRFFSPEDRADEPAAAPVAVISESLWRRRFHADPAIVGRSVKLNRHDFTIIGIAPAGFLGSLNGLAFDLWVPLQRHGDLMGPSKWLETRGWASLHMLGRLAPGATLESVRAESNAIAPRLTFANDNSDRGIRFAVLPIAQSPHGAQSHLTRPLLLLLGVCGLLLIVVCANLANLLLVRASGRQREMRIRQALGAGRLRLVGEMIGESLLLSAAGALVGLLFTLWLSDLLRRFIPDATLPISLEAGLSGSVFALAVVLSAGTALAAGLAPALWNARGNLMDLLRGGGRCAALTPRVELFRRTLVVAQVATALVTLACAALAAKSFHAAKRANPGFDASGVLLAGLRFDTSGYQREQASALLERVPAQIAALPGVESVALAEEVPLGLNRGGWEEVSVPGYVPAAGEWLRVYRNLVSPGYFSLMRIPLLTGREFNDQDHRGQPGVAIVNETFVRRYLGTGEAVGRTFAVSGGRRQLTIVGVVRDIKVYTLGEAAAPYYYVPWRQFLASDTGIALHVRTSAADPLTLLPAVRQAIRALDPQLPIFEALTLAEYTSAARFAQKIAASLLTVLSGVALALAALGLYGVLAFTVAQRTPEIGLRLALGAAPRDIARLVFSRGAALVGLGLGVGLLAAAAIARLLATMLFGVAPFEPVLLAATLPPIMVAAFTACWLPARQATKVDPLTALRAE